MNKEWYCGYLIRRSYELKQTLGHFVMFNGTDPIWSCCTLELPWLNNDRDVSCIPGDATYPVEKRTSDRYGEHFHVTAVPKRQLILIHQGNYNFQTRGCILVGKTHTDINGDGVRDVTSSRDTMRNLLSVAPAGWPLVVVS